MAPSAAPLNPDGLRLLARLWLHEADAEALGLAADRLGLPAAEPVDLATAYTELFLLNVYPYGTVFTDPSGELNGPGAQHLAAMYAANGYEPPELAETAAPDHLGLCLGFMAHLEERRLDAQDYISELLAWGPVCCLAVEREPAAHPFYRSLAKLTRERLLARQTGSHGEAAAADVPRGELAVGLDEEVRLRDLVRFFLAPARCGMFLSRGRLGHIGLGLGLRLPFGSRFDVAEALFQAAGEAGQVAPLIAALEAEVDVWRQEYARWADEQPNWRTAAGVWLARASQAIDRLDQMRQAVEADRL